VVLRSGSRINLLPPDKRRVGLTGAGLEVTVARSAFPYSKHLKSLPKAIPYPLEQAQFGRHQNATELQELIPPFTSSPATGKATRRPATKTLLHGKWLFDWDQFSLRSCRLAFRSTITIATG